MDFSTDTLTNMGWNGLYTLGNMTIQLAIAVVVILAFFVVGYAVALAINWLIVRALEFKHITLEERIKKRGLEKALMGFSITKLITLFVKVYVVFAFLGAAADILAINFISRVVSAFLTYLPSLAQGVAIVAGTMLVATYVGNHITADRNMRFGNYIAAGFKIALTYVALLMALPLVLPNVSVDPLMSILSYLMLVLVVGVGLAVGLAVGLGLKEPIAKAAMKNQEAFDDFFGNVTKKR
ncbi:MAG: hypothetical protein V1672_03225 [Candidatus Diapherotrites archaeon]